MGAKGQPKTPGSGKKKGQPHRKTRELMAQLEQDNFDTVQELQRLYWKLEKLECRKEENIINKIQVQSNMLLEMMSYLYPKRAAVTIDHQIDFQGHIVWDFRYGDSETNDLIPPTDTPPVEVRAIEQKI